MIENIYFENIKKSFKMQEEVYLSDLIFPIQEPKYRTMSETFSKEAVAEVQKLLIGIYGDEILKNIDFFKEFCNDNYIHPVEVLALKTDIIAFEDVNPLNLTRQFARVKRIRIIDIDSEDFHIAKFKRYVLKANSKFMFAIDKRFKFNDLGKYFAHLGENFYEFAPGEVSIKSINAVI